MLYYQRMTPSKNDIKKWLKASRKSREWLAEQCGVNKRQVDNWLSAARPVPSKALLIIQRLMAEKTSPISPQVELDFTDEEWEVISAAMTATQQTFMEFINSAFRNALKEFADIALQNAAKEKEAARKKFTLVEAFTEPVLEAQGQIIGNIAAGNLADGDTIPQDIRLYRELEKGEYLLRVNGHSMEPSIPDGSVVIMKKYTIPPIPKPGTIVQYHDERGVTLKNWFAGKTRKPAKWNTPSIPSTPTSETSNPWTAAKSPASMWKHWTGGRKLDAPGIYVIGKSSFLFSVSRPRWETRAVFYCYYSRVQ